MTESMPGLAERLKTLRGKMSQAAFAKMCGIQQSSYSKWEIGGMPNSANLFSICQATGASADWLLGLSPGEAKVSATGDHNAQAVNGGTASVVDGRSCKDCQTVARLLETISALTRK